MIKKLTYIFIAIFSVQFLTPVSVHAQSGAIVSGAAGCAFGGAIESMITSSLGGLFGGLGGTAGGGIGGIVGGATAVPVADQSLRTAAAKQERKAFTLDRLASCAAKQLLHQMTLATIDWINSGFDGKPAFLTNPEEFLLYTADQLTGEMISNNGVLQGLCSPWNVDVRLAIALDQSALNQFGLDRYKYRCTLAGIIDAARNSRLTVGASLNGFIGGDFRQGGWPAFLEMTVGMHNPAAAYLMARSGAQQLVDQRTGAIKFDLQLGNGFRSETKCEEVPASQAGGRAGEYTISTTQTRDGYVRRCYQSTPGSVLAHMLNKNAESGIVQAELANDINAVVSALANQLVNQLLTKGLTGLSNRGSGVSFSGSGNLSSYTDQLRREAFGQSTFSSGGTTFSITGGNIGIVEPGPYEKYGLAIDSLRQTEGKLREALACFQAKSQEYQTSGNSAGQAFADTNIATINSNLENDVAGAITALEASQYALAGKTTFTEAERTAANVAYTSALESSSTLLQNAELYIMACNSPGI